MNSQFIKNNPFISAFISATIALPLVFAVYFSFEPVVALGQVSEEFTITQTVDQEIAFVAEPNNVTLDGTIGGLTAGISNGTTTFSVSSNSPTGYTITLGFATNDTDQALVYDADPDEYFFVNADSSPVDNLLPPGSGEAPRFGYSVGGPNVATTLQDDGSECDTPNATSTGFACFFMQADPGSAFTIINSTQPTAGVDENFVVFRAVAGPNPSPALPHGTYTATATLTAQVQ